MFLIIVQYFNNQHILVAQDALAVVFNAVIAHALLIVDVVVELNLPTMII